MAKRISLADRTYNKYGAQVTTHKQAKRWRAYIAATLRALRTAYKGRTALVAGLCSVMHSMQGKQKWRAWRYCALYEYLSQPWCIANAYYG